MQPSDLGRVLATMSGQATLKRYHLYRRARLRDGTPILVRTLQPGDRAELARGFARLSAGSRRFRFLAPLHKLTPVQLRELTEVDQHDHVAIAARDESRPDHPGIGVARFVRLEQDPGVAEFAITVIDEYQNRGLGTLLLNLLLKAAQTLQVRTLRGFLLADNLAMLHLLHKFEATWRRAWDNTLGVDLPVPLPAP
jgi:RimJ/RimL family protein N-acetyltransferase